MALKKPVRFRKNFNKTSRDKFGNACVVINPKEHCLVLTTESHFLDNLSGKGCVYLYAINTNQIDEDVDTYIKNSFSDYLLRFNVGTLMQIYSVIMRILLTGVGHYLIR